MKDFLIRADASASIGAGHLSRMLALAAGLRELGGPGVTVSFAAAPLPDVLAKKVLDEGFRLYSMPKAHNPPDVWPFALEEAQELKALKVLAKEALAMGAARNPMLIIDHYGYDKAMIESAASLYPSVALVDDYQPERLTQTVSRLLNPTFSARAVTYPDFDNQQRLLGPGYALLSPQLRQTAKKTTAALSAQKCQRVLLCFGFGDTARMSLPVLQALNMVGNHLEITLLAHLKHPDAGQIAEMARQSLNRLHWLPYCEDMPNLLSKQDLAIVSASTIAHEALALAVPTAVIACVDNQYPAAKAMDEAGVAYYLGTAAALRQERLEEGLAKRLQPVVEDDALRGNLARAGAVAVNQDGALKTAEILLGI
ncbi:MAG: hypothetical protein VKJ04_12280 [Vampirovibrionales bacterium]|nr:hypothetical protein [Vampirovibrionales bacterium]